MRTLILVASQFGNTARIAEAMARGLAASGEVRVLAAADPAARAALDERPDLVLVGGPTQNRGVTRDLATVLDGLAPAFAGLRVAAFDTRIRGSELIMGSAAKRIADRLAKAGAVAAAPRECFFVRRVDPPAGERKGPQHIDLEPGEEARAEAWAAALATALSPTPAG